MYIFFKSLKKICVEKNRFDFFFEKYVQEFSSGRMQADACENDARVSLMVNKEAIVRVDVK